MGRVKQILNFIWKILYKILVITVIFMCILAIVQKTTDNKGSICGIKIFTVITGSMIPVYNIGDVLIVKEISPSEIKVDDDIVYNGEKGTYRNKVITHRVLSVDKKSDGNYRIITKGVANIAQDPEINQTQVIGKVIGKIGVISLVLRLVTNIYVWMLIPVIILIRINIKRIRQHENM